MSSGAANGHVLDLANDALTCPREATVAALWNQLQKVKLFMFGAHLPAENPRWLNFSKST
jgi:hypothetical protein